MTFAHLHVHSYYSFHDAVCSPADIVKAAAEKDVGALALTDHNSVSGLVEFQLAAEEYGIKPISGVEITLEDGSHLVLLAKDPIGYENICKILTKAFAKSDRRNPRCSYDVLEEYSSNIFALSGCRHGKVPSLILSGQYAQAEMTAKRFKSIFGDSLILELQNQFLPNTRRLNQRMIELAEHLGLEVTCTNNVHYVDKDMYRICDVLCCIRLGITIDKFHPLRPLNGEAYLKSKEEMKCLLSEYPECIYTMERITSECTPGIVFERDLFPMYNGPSGYSNKELLRKLVFEGAEKRYQKITSSIADRLNHELDIINRLRLEGYFLVVWDIVQEARSRGIRYAGRGSAADSAVAYCLGITQVDSIKRGLLFERFLSLERSQKPDIDIDFEAGRRDEIIQYVYHKYGGNSHCVAGVCTFSTYRARSALRDVGAVLKFSEEEIDRLAKKFPHVSAESISEAIHHFPELRKSGINFRRYSQLFEICERLAFLPRFIGTHLGGIVVSKEPLTCVTPLLMGASNRMITQFDKRSIEELCLIKLDFLSLRTLSAINDCMEQIESYCKESHEEYCTRQDMINLDNISLDDEGVYSMLQRGETIGVFQLESPAQRALQTRLEADRFEDVVASLALIRPGPIEGNMVESFISCRTGEKSPSYLHPKLEGILKRTYGVVLYQEQVIEIATEIAGFTPGESDKLRKAMTHARSRSAMDEIGEMFRRRAIARGISPDVAEQVFSFIKGYAGYGFCEAHAAAFADTAYKTAYLAKYFPEYYYAALLNNQPMGFYSPGTLCVEVRRRGIRINPVDVNESQGKFTATKGNIRIGLKQVKGMSDAAIQSILRARRERAFTSIFDFCKRVSIDRDILKNLVLCGAFDSLHKNRREALWYLPQAVSHGKYNGSLITDCELPGSGREIEDFTDFEKVLYEYSILGLSHECHPMEFIKPLLPKSTLSTSEVKEGKDKEAVAVAGLVIRPHRPPTRSGRTVAFLSLEDGEGLVDITVFERVYQEYGHLLFSKPILLIHGTVSRRGKGVSVIANKVFELIY